MQGLEIFNLANLARLGDGLLVTIYISFVSILVSIIGGLIMGILMSLNNKILYLFCRVCLEIVRIMPTIVWLFLVYFGLSVATSFEITAKFASILVFSIWGVFEMMDLVRASLKSIPKHQYESAITLGLKTYQIYIFVIIPQALRRLTPAVINLLSRMIKTTSIVVLIGVVEVVKVGQQIIEVNVFSNDLAPFYIYSLIFFIYFIICYPISKLSKILEKKYN